MNKRIVTIVIAVAVAIFLNVNDKPIVSYPDEYLRLVTKGMVYTDICGENAQLFWGDFSPKEREILQLMLRTP